MKKKERKRRQREWKNKCGSDKKTQIKWKGDARVTGNVMKKNAKRSRGGNDWLGIP